MHLRNDLSAFEAFAADQQSGRWVVILDPIKGADFGLQVLIAGPDSDAQRYAELAMVDELAAAADEAGRVSAEARERARLNALAKCILDWTLASDGTFLPCTHENKLRLLKAGKWIQSQIDAAAAERRAKWGRQNG